MTVSDKTLMSRFVLRMPDGSEREYDGDDPVARVRLLAEFWDKIQECDDHDEIIAFRFTP